MLLEGVIVSLWPIRASLLQQGSQQTKASGNNQLNVQINGQWILLTIVSEKEGYASEKR